MFLQTEYSFENIPPFFLKVTVQIPKIKYTGKIKLTFWKVALNCTGEDGKIGLSDLIVVNKDRSFR